jgi:hypothetical protein
LKKRLRRRGIDPHMAAIALAYAAIAGARTVRWRNLCKMRRVPANVSVAIAVALLLLGSRSRLRLHSVINL